MRRVLPLLTLLIAVPMFTAGQDTRPSADREFAALFDTYIARFKPLTLAAESAWWDANITGTDVAYARKKEADNALVDLHSDPATFAKLKALKEGGQVSDPLLRRELDVMYRTYLPGQADPQLQKRIVALENDVSQIFNNYRGHVADRTLTENDVRDILSDTTDPAAAESAWKAYMDVGAQVSDKLRELVKLRNESARQLGFRDYFAMSLNLQELDEQQLFKLFDELDAQTRAPFAALKTKIDADRAARFHIEATQLRPWHFGDLFFQEAPGGQTVNLDDLFDKADLLALARKYYASIGLPVDDILARSDLYEKPGKCPHAFCADLDRAGDIRVLANVKPNVYWADTMLHELGHGVYDKYIRADVPFLLHESSHAITTEGIALLFGALTKNEEWLTQVAGVEPAQAARVGQAARDSLRTEQLLFTRWTQVILRFERSMYADPDQDLAKLWADLRQRYQLLTPPDGPPRPDYAAKVHILTHPVYYQNYMLGELFASQVRHYVARDVLGLKVAALTSFHGHPEVGTYLRDKVFGPGDLYMWSDLTQRATGEALTPKYFVEEFVQ